MSARRWRRRAAVLAALLGCGAALAGGQEPQLPAGDATRDAAISSEELEAHVQFLASDALGGRDTASAGEALATAYLAERLEALDWEPAGDDGFLQRVPLAIGAPTEAPSLTGVADGGERIDYAFGTDFTLYAWGVCEGSFELTTRDGLEAPLGDVAGRALFVDEGGEARGALAARLAELGDERPGLALLAGPTSEGRPVGRLPRGRLTRAAEVQGRTPLLRARGGLLEDLRAGRLKALSVDLHYELERSTAHNVVARLAARDESELAGETVVLSAHIDHLGTRPTEPDPDAPDPDAPEGAVPDGIYNGADDDASGGAVLLEVAEALALGPAPAREVVLLFATGEERGLLGTFEYLERPAAPLERTVYNLNFEMLGRPDALAGGPGGLWFTGFERTTVGPALEALGVELTPDPRPSERFFERSDNIAFVLRDIPGQTLSSFDLHDDYHTPADEWRTLDYAHMAAAATLAARATRAIVDGDVPVEWVEGGRLVPR